MAGDARNCTPTVTVRSSEFSMVIGTRPLSPENVTVPSESTPICATCSLSWVEILFRREAPTVGSERHADDSARNSAAA